MYIDESVIGLSQVYDCTCLGNPQKFECMVYGGGLTIWQGGLLHCPQSQDTIHLRHSQFADGQAVGECSDGQGLIIVARSIRRLGDYYTSVLNFTVEQRILNETIECVHQNTSGQSSTIGQTVLWATSGKTA